MSKNHAPNIVDMIIKKFLDEAPLLLGVDSFSQGQMAERRRIRTILANLRFPDREVTGNLPAIGLDDIGTALIRTVTDELSEEEFDLCVKYTNRLIKRFASRQINAAKVLAVCGMILTVSGEIQKEHAHDLSRKSSQ